MDKNLMNRMQKPPPTPQQELREAQVDTTQRQVPPLVCPVCQRGMTPRVERWRPNGQADCMCSLNSCRFAYTPAQVRPR